MPKRAPVHAPPDETPRQRAVRAKGQPRRRAATRPTSKGKVAKKPADGIDPKLANIGDTTARMMQALYTCRSTDDLVAVDPVLRRLARALAYELLLVGYSTRAPRDQVTHARTFVRAWQSRGNARPWHRVLHNAFIGHRLIPTDGAKGVAFILGQLRSQIVVVEPDDLPVGLRQPNTEALANAAAALPGIVARVTRGKPGGHGKRLSPWGAAAELAGHLGEFMPPTESEALRTRRTPV